MQKRRRAPPDHTLTGDIRFHTAFRSEILGDRRTVAVYLPPGYPEERCPVLYLQDGQNVFDRATAAYGVEWEADETTERLVLAGAIRPVVLVAVYNTPRRSEEYTAPGPHRPEGRADLYARFLCEELKPFIDATYRTRTGRADTAVGGSSLGGTLSLYACARHPDTFGLCAALSPALWWQGSPFLSDLESRLATDRIWLQCGTAEGKDGRRFLAGARRLARMLHARGLAHRYLEVRGGTHDEAAWAAHFDDLLRYFFPSS